MKKIFTTNDSKPGSQTNNSYINYLINSRQIPDLTYRIKHTRPEDIAYLRDTKRHLKDPRFKKSSYAVMALLLALIYFLYKYF